ncbi:hypothetical protein F4604DRAFT_1711226 [Suillus subluteus]|nr:hypothetical protein F4604DRAFT_1711226 [Suillus subluteus]
MLCSGSAQVSLMHLSYSIKSFTILILVFTASPMYHMLNCTPDHTSTFPQSTPSPRTNALVCHLQVVNTRHKSRAQGVHLTVSLTTRETIQNFCND